MEDFGCSCGSGIPRSQTWEEYDGRGIYLCRVCSKCVKERLSRYRPEILRYYNENDVDEAIEAEPSWDDE